MNRYPTTSNLITMCLLLASEPRERVRSQSPCTLTEYRVLKRILATGPETMSGMAQALGVSCANVSIAVKSLIKLGFVDSMRQYGAGRRVTLSSTREGEMVARLCDEVVSETYQELFSACGEASVMIMGAGHMASAISLGNASYKPQGPDFDVACLETYLACEQNITKHAQSYGFTTSEFRVLFRLLEKGTNLSYLNLGSDLLLMRSTVSETCSRLSKKGLVEIRKVDGKSRAAFLSPLGQAVAKQVGDLVDESLAYGIRNSDRRERMVYVASADEIVRGKRRTLRLEGRVAK